MNTGRREFLATSLFAGAALNPLTGSEEHGNPVQVENARPGTRDWLLTHPRIDPSTKYRCPWIEGYGSKTSLQAGDSIDFHISTRPGSAFTIDIYRMGFYGGTGGRFMRQLGPIQGTAQPDPPIGEKRLRDCAWEKSATLNIPEDWLSGVYLGKLTELAGGTQSYVIFIVRDHRKAGYLFQCSDHTWQAYNRWPDHFALYDDGKSERYWGGSIQVSFNRPYGRYCQIFDAPLDTGSGEFLLWEFPVAYWMEQQGFDVTYISNQDTHRDAEGLKRAAGFLSVGHDEYWTMEMFRNVQAAIASGVNAAFFSGNAVCGKVLYDARLRAFERVARGFLARPAARLSSSK